MAEIHYFRLFPSRVNVCWMSDSKVLLRASVRHRMAREVDETLELYTSLNYGYPICRIWEVSKIYLPSACSLALAPRIGSWEGDVAAN